jgi:hypothetical protein
LRTILLREQRLWYVSKHVLTDFLRGTKQVPQGKDSQKQYQPETTST